MTAANSRLDGSPWSRRHLVVLAVPNGLASTVLFAGWRAIAGEASLSHQTPWLNLGVIAVVAAAAADVAWLGAGRRALLARRRRIIERAFDD